MLAQNLNKEFQLQKSKRIKNLLVAEGFGEASYSKPEGLQCY